MKLLYGTTNTAKLAHMRRCLTALGIELFGLCDLPGEIPEVEECGKDPLENARLKAETYYAAYHMPVFSCDSGLYFEGVPDEVQPGVHVRNVGGRRLSDDEMVDFYSTLARQYGGELVARYKNAVCLILDETRRYESMDDSLSGAKFLLTANRQQEREAGFPLDSLSLRIDTREPFCKQEHHDVGAPSGFFSFFKSVQW